MKKTLYTVLCAASVAMLSSCESDIDNFMVNDTVGLLNPGLVNAKVFAGLDDPYDIYVLKSGKGFNSAEVTISVDNNVLTSYNEENGTEYTAIPTDCYTVTVNSLSLTPDTYRAPFVITWNRDKLSQALEKAQEDKAALALPMRMTVSGAPELNIDEERLTTIIVPQIEAPLISFEKPGRVTGVMPTRRSPLEEVVYMNIVSNFIAKEDIGFTLSIDESLIEEYNDEHDTNFKLLPPEAYDLDLNKWQIKKYLDNCLFNFTFKREALIPEKAASKFGEYMLPIRISKTSAATIDEKSSYVLYTVSVIASELSKTGMSIISCSNTIQDDPDQILAKGDYKPEYLLDGTTQTSWRSTWSNKPELPYEFVVDLGKDCFLSKVGFENPVGTNATNSNTKDFYYEFSTDGENWTNKVEGKVAFKTSAVTEVEIETVRARYVKFVVTSVYNTRQPRNSIAEFNFWGEATFD